MRAYLGLTGGEGNEAKHARLVGVVDDRLHRGGLGLAVGSEHAGDVRNCPVHEDEMVGE
jgi:hypothetical protein